MGNYKNCLVSNLTLRRRVAERIAVPLKRAGVETPIIEEITHAAEVISAFYYQAMQQHGQLALPHIPAFAHGKAYGEVAGLWYRVTFPKPIGNPNVVAVAEGRRGEIPEVRMPTITVPRVKVPTVELPTIRDVTVPDFVLPYVRESIGRFECGWSAAGLTDGLNDMIGILEDGLKRINNIIDRANAAMAEIRKNIREVYGSVKEFREKVQKTFNTYTADLQDLFNTHIADLEGRINEGLGRILPALYMVWGIPSNMAVTPVHIRNVTNLGFEFQSFGKTTIHWICIGARV
jgi:hypothetical protein